MRIPQFYIGASLLFWGVESANLIFALPLALLLEASHFLSQKYNFTEDDFIRISDLNSIVFLMSLGLILINKEPIFFFRIINIWLPLILIPLIAAQLYSTNDKIIIGTKLSLKKTRGFRHKPMDFRVYYAIICLFSTAAVNSRSAIFFPCMAVLLFWLIFANRGQGHPVWLIPFCFIFITAGSFYGSKMTVTSNEWMISKFKHMLHNYYSRRHADPFKTTIAYGSIGRLKLSGKIILRVEKELLKKDMLPFFLHEANYNVFHKNSWQNIKHPFSVLKIGINNEWQITPPPHPAGQQLSVEQNFNKKKGVLLHPPNSFTTFSTNLFELETNNTGTLKSNDVAPIVSSTFHYRADRSLVTDLPTSQNLQIPKEELEHLSRIAGEIWPNIDELSKKQKIKHLLNYFNKNFSYTLNLQNKDKMQTVLANFLTRTKQGHCELFATSTTLLLRLADIESRYVTGFVTEEFSPLEDRYIVRERHGHAWAEAYIDGNWLRVDTTPANWSEIDQNQASFTESLGDLIAYFKHKYDRYRLISEDDYTLPLSILLVLLSLFLIYRIYRRMQLQKNSAETVGKSQKKFIPQDSPFNTLIEELEKLSIPRRSNEPFLQWLERVQRDIADISVQNITRLYRFHQRLRFDPTPLSQNEMERYCEEVKHEVQCLQKT